MITESKIRPDTVAVFCDNCRRALPDGQGRYHHGTITATMLKALRRDWWVSTDGQRCLCPKCWKGEAA